MDETGSVPLPPPPSTWPGKRKTGRAPRTVGVTFLVCSSVFLFLGFAFHGLIPTSQQQQDYEFMVGLAEIMSAFFYASVFLGVSCAIVGIVALRIHVVRLQRDESNSVVRGTEPPHD